MKQTVLNQLQEYSKTISSINGEVAEYEKLLVEKKKILEQHKGAYSAMFNLALSQGYIDSSGNIIEDNKDKK